MRKLYFPLICLVSLISCTAETVESPEDVTFQEEELTTCRNATVNGETQKVICEFDRNNTNPADNLASYDVAYWDSSHTGCWRLEISSGFGPDCFLTKGYHPDTASRRSSVLIDDALVGIENRGWKNVLKSRTNDSSFCAYRWVKTCTL